MINYQQYIPKITDKKDIKLLLYQLKVPIVMILEIAVGTQIPKILKGFLCQDKIWLSMSKDGTY